ncbi:hypothetical protein LX36DRAFT_175979 [Colletotrichum falcatum]|nr:hypothetical protein LX36DRAFT_175979 [Colletotrichum falcatum]
MLIGNLVATPHHPSSFFLVHIRSQHSVRWILTSKPQCEQHCCFYHPACIHRWPSPAL